MDKKGQSALVNNVHCAVEEKQNYKNFNIFVTNLDI
jgi:hypothetical protein